MLLTISLIFSQLLQIYCQCVEHDPSIYQRSKRSLDKLKLEDTNSAHMRPVVFPVEWPVRPVERPKRNTNPAHRSLAWQIARQYAKNYLPQTRQNNHAVKQQKHHSLTQFYPRKRDLKLAHMSKLNMDITDLVRPQTRNNKSLIGNK